VSQLEQGSARLNIDDSFGPSDGYERWGVVFRGCNGCVLMADAEYLSVLQDALHARVVALETDAVSR
jgi:hypothetical protein